MKQNKRLRAVDEKKEKQNELKDLFKRLDSDDDGHVNFEILYSHFGNNFNEQQKTFFHQVINFKNES